MKKTSRRAVYILAFCLLMSCGAGSSTSASTLTITSGAPPNGIVGTPYGGTHTLWLYNHFITFTGWQLRASGGVGSYKWSWAPKLGSSLPPGLSIGTVTRFFGGSTRCCVTVSIPVIEGTPTAAGTYYVVVTVTDSGSPAAQAHAAYTITIAKSPTAALSLKPNAASLIAASSAQHSRYKLIDLGTLGGPNSSVPTAFYNGAFSQSISRQGVFAGQADSTTPDPFAPNCFNNDCFASHAIEWKDGQLIDLGTLPGPAGLSSAATWISDNTQIAGFSENGVIDPFTSAPAVNAVVWKQGKITELGVLGNGYESAAFSVNNRGEVAGFASNLSLDSNSLVGVGTQARAVIWRNGSIQDLGTLGGSDAVALYINESGQVAGTSYTAGSVPTPNPLCGDQPLTVHGFFWENGKMADIGALGGSCTLSYALNNRGQIVGQSTLPEDQTSHPFLWEKGKIQDLGTLGGDYGYSSWINDLGEVVGSASTTQPHQDLVAFRWKDGAISSLGALEGDSCSGADAINSSGLTVGGSGLFIAPFFPGCTDAIEHAVLWEGGQIFDLNLLVTNHSDLTLNEATFINDRGEIGGFATLHDGENFVTHAFLLIPCDDNHPSEGCDDGDHDLLPMQNGSAPVASAQEMANDNDLRARGVPGQFHVRLAGRPRSSVLAAPAAPYQLTTSVLNTYQIKLNWQEVSGQNQTGFNVYRCKGCTNPRTMGTKVISLSASTFTYTDGAASSPLTQSTAYTYQVSAVGGGGESGPSNASSATTMTEPAPTNLGGYVMRQCRTPSGCEYLIPVRWTNNSTDDDSYYVETCSGLTCTNFIQIARLGANATSYLVGFPVSNPGRTVRFRVRTHSPGGYSSYSNIWTHAVP